MNILSSIGGLLMIVSIIANFVATVLLGSAAYNLNRNVIDTTDKIRTVKNKNILFWLDVSLAILHGVIGTFCSLFYVLTVFLGRVDKVGLVIIFAGISANLIATGLLIWNAFEFDKFTDDEIEHRIMYRNLYYIFAGVHFVAFVAGIVGFFLYVMYRYVKEKPQKQKIFDDFQYPNNTRIIN